MKFINATPTSTDTVSAADPLMTLAQWQASRSDWPAQAPACVTVPNDVDIETLEADLPQLAVIALQFPKWVDGRAYSQARLLRSRFGFRGELRATGEVLVDMLPLLQRTGFDAVQLRADQDLEEARAALQFFVGPDAHYQGDVQVHAPIFQRRAA
ncbi:MAG: DUF934 domain-containing protein [Burkholderiaceae bacterium]